MRISVNMVTTVSDIEKAAEFTVGKELNISNWGRFFKSQHSPIRMFLFDIEMIDIPTFVSVHFVRHSTCGQLHYVKSNRPDRGGSDTVDRNTKVNHLMRLNAQHLIDMSHVRLCHKASKETREVMEAIKQGVDWICPELAKYMVPSCLYLSECPEFKPCRRAWDGK